MIGRPMCSGTKERNVLCFDGKMGCLMMNYLISTQRFTS